MWKNIFDCDVQCWLFVIYFKLIFNTDLILFKIVLYDNFNSFYWQNPMKRQFSFSHTSNKGTLSRPSAMQSFIGVRNLSRFDVFKLKKRITSCITNLWHFSLTTTYIWHIYNPYHISTSTWWTMVGVYSVSSVYKSPTYKNCIFPNL